MAITAELVKNLRDRTGAGMMDCKAVLVETNGDIEAAIDLLRTRGIAKAEKKGGRTASDGVLATWLSDDHTAGMIIEVNCETDFVARTDDFQALVQFIRDQAITLGDGATAEWAQDPNGPIHPRIQPVIAKLGEKITVSRIVRFAGRGVVTHYIHLGGKIGVLVEATGVDASQANNDDVKALLKEVALQIAAAMPTYLSRADVPADVLEREKNVYRAQMADSGKPANVIEKIIEGKLGSFYEQNVLVDQPSIRDPKVKVSQVIAQAVKAIGSDVAISRFARVKVGEQA